MQGEELWWRGPKWLAAKESWPYDFVMNSTPQSQAEAKVTEEVFAGAREVTDEFDVLLKKFALWKMFRASAWILRSMNNTCKHKEQSSTRGSHFCFQSLHWLNTR